MNTDQKSNPVIIRVNLANYTADEVKDALAFQKLKNEIIGLAEKWDEYAKAQAIAKEKWFRHQGIDVYTVKVYPNGSHNLMGVPPDNPNEFVRLKRSHRVFETMVDWTNTTSPACQHGVRPLTLLNPLGLRRGQQKGTSG